MRGPLGNLCGALCVVRDRAAGQRPILGQRTRAEKETPRHAVSELPGRKSSRQHLL